MGKCFSCLKSASSASREQNSAKDPVKTDFIIPTVDENMPMMIANSQCAVPHLQTMTTVFFQRNSNSCSLSSRRNCEHVKEKSQPRSSRLIYPKIPSVALSSAAVSDSDEKGTSGSSWSKNVSVNKINALYNQYKDPVDGNYVLADGIEKFCADLKLLPDEFKVLLLAWKFGARQMCQFGRAEFVDGCLTMGVDSVKGMQQRLSEIYAEVETDEEAFRSLYKYTFGFGLDNNAGQRILPIDMAVSLWKLVFTVHTPPILRIWLEFLTESSYTRGIARDTWNMFLNFCEYVGDDLSRYDDTEAWPSVFDEFVEFENDKIGNRNSQLSPMNAATSSDNSSG